MIIGTFNEFYGYKGTIEYDFETDRLHGELIGVKYKTLYEANDIEQLFGKFRRMAKAYNRTIEE